MRILIVEDERKVGRFIERALSEQYYIAHLATSCAAGRAAVGESDFDAVILDLGLPDGDGLSLLQEWRSAGNNMPVLILSARDAVDDRIHGLNLGADDYLPKPFSIDELLARVRSLLRRHAEIKSTVLKHRNITLDLLAREASSNGVKVMLTSREFALLELFMQSAGRVLTRTFIAEKVWHAHVDIETNLIDVYVRRLRLKLEQEGGKPAIHTVRGTGYQLQ